MGMAGSLLTRGGGSDFEVLFTLGVAEAALGHELGAKRHLRAALAIESTNPFVLAALAELESGQ